MTRATVAALAVGMAGGAVLAQPVHWRLETGGNGHWYEVVPVAAGGDCWDANRVLAEARGGYLATITGQAENQFVAALVLPFAGRNCSLGAFLNLSAGVWRWVTGEPFAYTNWQIGEPGCCAPQEYWLDMNAGSGRWRDRQQCVGDGTPGVSGIAVIEYSADCNNDGIVDKGQILSGQLPDANNNGIPDWNVSITRQPVDQAVGVDQPVFFVVETEVLGNCSTPVSYRWQRRNPLVADENATNAWLDLQDGGGFLNSGTASLTILRPTPALATGYRCRISGGCGCEGTVAGAAYTNTVNFGVACPADFNADGGIDFGDVEAFFERWENGC